MPAKRVTFCNQMMVKAPLSGVLHLCRHRFARFGFKPCPIEWEGSGVEKSQQFLRSVLGLVVLLSLVFTIGERDQVKGGGAEEELMFGLSDHDLLIDQGCIV